MKQQNYDHHVRYYTAHHFIFYPLVTLAFVLCIRFGFYDALNSNLWYTLAAVFLFIAWLSFLTRQHYALINQNRTVRLELRFRYYALTHERLEIIESQLTCGQLYALRFAGDDELVALINRTLAEKLSPDEIKRSIRNWLPDHLRV